MVCGAAATTDRGSVSIVQSPLRSPSDFRTPTPTRHGGRSKRREGLIDLVFISQSLKKKKQIRYDSF